MKFIVESFTEPGPRPVNEDSIGVWNLPCGSAAVAIADGLGGMGGGDTASRIAINFFGEIVTNNAVDTIDLTQVAMQIHSKILSLQTSGTSESAMATTLTAAIFYGSILTGVHCGDSRLSIARADGIIRLTKDHTEAQRLFDQGKLTKSELRNYPRRNILDSALGAHKEPKIDKFHFDLQVGDKLFFTTDGLHEKVLLREIRELAAKFDDPGPFVEKVRNMVKNRVAEDNFSLIAVFS
jgi:PPM family protein phosphatase